ncbi:hypothetical protein LCGC14_1522960 [marine sediment metagenome]|uniref:Uncharacterized protein n=1 Tax=marine sediment metagenome TaxID=412755 RepID=A0A0F9LZ82_9ZZZZ
MIEKGKDTSICCNYCGWKVPHDFIQRIKENAGSLFCEFCGIDIESNINKTSEKDNKENLKSIKKSMVSENSNWQKSQKFSVRLIIKDEDFPKIFKENLIIVISRLIYIYIRIWEQETNTLASRETITKSSFYNLACKIKPIIDRKVSNNFLGNLHKINIEEFEDWLRLLQKKLHTDESYLNHFKIFLLWLLKIVIKLISEMWEMKNIPTFHSTILNDLKNYNFSFATIEEEIRVGTNDITDNNATRLIKTIINQIYENKRALEQYNFRQKETNEFTFLKGKDIFYPQLEVLGSISPYNLGKFLGVSRSKARNWLKALDHNKIIKLPDLEFRKIRATIFRFFQGDGESIVKSRQIIKYAIETYMDKFYNSIDFITKIVLFLDECAIWEKIEQSKGDPHSLLSISKRMGMNQNYLLEIKKRIKNSKSNQFSKFFTLSTNILLLKYSNFKFKNRKSYEKFKTRALDIIFQEMVQQGIFSDENAELMKRQYSGLVYTLYALTKAKSKRFSLLKSKPENTGKDKKGIYTLSDLSRKIGGRKLLADYLLYEIFISRETLAEIKNHLDENKGYAPIECEFALNLLNEIPRIRLGQRPSYVGRLSHPILENFFRKLWLKLGIKSKHEFKFNYPNSVHRIDSALDVSKQQKLRDLLKSSSYSSLSKFKSLFIDYTIPNLVRCNLCVLNKISPEKKYLAKNRSVILVFYGIYSEKIFKTLQKKLNSLKLDYKKNIHFMDITEFIQLFTNNVDDLRELDEINTLIKKALDDDNEEALEELERKADDAFYDLSKYNK